MPRSPVDLLIVNAAELVTCSCSTGRVTGPDLSQLQIITDGAVAIKDGWITDVGTTSELRARVSAARILDARHRLVTPGLVDCHTHLIFSGSRTKEYEAKLTGALRVDEQVGSGILQTAASTSLASPADLARQAKQDLDVMLAHGTTTVEVKTGYGLAPRSEVRLLRVLSELHHTVDIVRTLLAAHVMPTEYGSDRRGFLEQVISILPECRTLAEFCDLCCDPVGFTTAECRRVGVEAQAAGFRLKFHADQTGRSGGAALAVECRATSADHLDWASHSDVKALADSQVVAVLTPGANFHMLELSPQVGSEQAASKPWLPSLVHDMISSGVCIALTTDYNPGSAPIMSMQLAMQLAARLYRLDYATVWHMATINAATALDRGSITGSIEVGKRADVITWLVPSHGMVVERMGANLVDIVVKTGRVVVEGGVLVR